jgi:hypothetical protein
MTPSTWSTARRPIRWDEMGRQHCLSLCGHVRSIEAWPTLLDVTTFSAAYLRSDPVRSGKRTESTK